MRRSIPEYSLYEVDEQGVVYRLAHVNTYRTLQTNREVSRVKPEKVLRQFTHRDGYLLVTAFNDKGKEKQVKVHRLVALAFLPKILGKEMVCHKNGIPSDNRVENLCWGNAQDNANHRKEHWVKVCQ